MTTRLWMGSACVALCVAAGCREDARPPFPSWTPPAASRPGRGFLAYADAAREAEARSGEYAARVHFTPGMKARIVRALERPLQLVAAGAAASDAAPAFEPSAPFARHPHQPGWRMLGRALRWRAEAAAASGDFGSAIADASLATAFGFDLTHGSASDADLGLAIADEARLAILPYLDRLSPAQLAALRDGMKRALERKPTLVGALRNEKLNMLAAVDAVQDAYREGRYEELQRRLGPEARDALAYLKEMSAEDGERRLAYFRGFAAEAEAEAERLAEAALLPAAKRGEAEGTGPAPDRPWRRLAKHFFRAGRPLLSRNDATLARTRMLVLQAEVLRQIKASGRAPADLARFPGGLKQDPYTGLPFVYKAEGPVFYLYSMGDDFRDDGGDTDAAFRRPDLVLERGQ